MTFSGMSAEKAWRRRSWGDGISRSGSSNIGELASDSSDGWARRRGRRRRSGVARCGGWIDSLAGDLASGSAALGRGRLGAAGASGSRCVPPSRPSSVVRRKRSASGPSRMLARLPVAMCEDLLGELPVGVGGETVGLVLQY